MDQHARRLEHRTTTRLKDIPELKLCRLKATSDFLQTNSYSRVKFVQDESIPDACFEDLSHFSYFWTVKLSSILVVFQNFTTIVFKICIIFPLFRAVLLETIT